MSGPGDARRADQAIAEMPGSAALPRRSGEMVFHHEWERRAFSLAVALCEKGHYEWDEFRRRLVASIDATAETPGHPDPSAPGYYEHWLAALERLLAEKGIADDPSAGDA